MEGSAGNWRGSPKAVRSGAAVWWARKIVEIRIQGGHAPSLTPPVPRRISHNAAAVQGAGIMKMMIYE